MKITGNNPLRNAPVKRAKSSDKAGEGGFASALQGGGGAAEAGDSAGTGGVTGSQPIGGIDALLALQEVDEREANRKQVMGRAARLLDGLEELRTDLLLGAVPRHKLERLVDLVHSRRARIDDPKLLAVLDEIDLRAQVELAKLQQPV